MRVLLLWSRLNAGVVVEWVNAGVVVEWVNAGVVVEWVECGCCCGVG